MIQLVIALALGAQTAPAPAPAPAAAIVEDKAAATPTEARKPDTKISIAVMDLATENVQKELIQSIGGAMADALDGLGPFDALSSQDIQRMMDFEAAKQSAGCTSDVSCLAEIADSMGVAYLVTGRITRIEGQFLMQLQLVEVAKAQVVARESRDYEARLPISGLVDLGGTAARALVRELLATRAGFLEVRSSELDATVRIDERIVGVTPLPRLDVGGGVHKVSVEKEGFVTAAKDVEIRQGETSLVELTLAPSADYRAKYIANANLVRVAAWSGVGVGVVGAGTGVALFLIGGALADDLRGRIDTYNAGAVKDAATHDALAADARAIGAMDVGVLVAAGTAVVGAAAGVIGLVVGPDPERYGE